MCKLEPSKRSRLQLENHCDSRRIQKHTKNTTRDPNPFSEVPEDTCPSKDEGGGGPEKLKKTHQQKV